MTAREHFYVFHQYPLSLSLSKAQRRALFWEGILARGLRQAQPERMGGYL